MSNNWSEGYFTDAGYTYGYYREINPVFQEFCLLLKGVATNMPSHAQHCELGFGQGVSINIHAAANSGHFIGTDFSPTHAAHANTLASASGSDALLYDDSFEQLLARTDLPKFDTISLHGIWTWVSRDNHKIITEFVRRHLKPGGSLYVSYNCFPGWSPAYPLRQLFSVHDRFSSPSGDVKHRIDSALAFAQQLLDAQPNYSKVVPQLSERLQQIAKQDRNYLAHEYFNSEWNCMYFTEVVDALSRAKVEYVGTASPLDLVDAIHLSPKAQDLLKGITQPILREQVRDYFVNQQFRKDFYVRGACRLTDLEQQQRFLDTRFVLCKPVNDVALTVTGAAGDASLQENVYKPVLEALAADAHAPKTARYLSSALKDVSMASLQQALIVLVGIGAVYPCQAEDRVAEVKPKCIALNRYLTDQALIGHVIETLASPVTGGGIGVARFPQMFLRAQALGKNQPAEWAQLTWEQMKALGQRIVKEGTPLQTEQEHLDELNAQAKEFGSKYLPILKALQIA